MRTRVAGLVAAGCHQAQALVTASRATCPAGCPSAPAPRGSAVDCNGNTSIDVSAFANLLAAGFKCTADKPFVDFVINAAQDGSSPFESRTALPQDVLDAARWSLARSPAEVVRRREQIMCKIEKAAAELRESGQVANWAKRATPSVARVAEGVNGPLFEKLLKLAGWCDPAVVDFFVQGAPLVGALPRSGVGWAGGEEAPVPVADPLVGAKKKNERMVARSRCDEFAEDLFDLTLQDAELGRMSVPQPLESVDMARSVVTPRFAVAQGLRPDGSRKIRAVDDCTASELNAATSGSEKMRHDTIDRLFELAALFAREGRALPKFWKADIDAAFRRIPLRPEDYHLAWVTFMHKGKHVAARHNACPFGAVSSVHNWERLGAAVAAIARRVLHIPALRYVDDFF